jgi:hypothetical protein
MAHGGMETVFSALLPVEERQRQEEVQGLLRRCGLPAYVTLAPPRRELAELEKWLGLEEDNGRHPLTAFLKLNRGDSRRLRTWLIDGEPVQHWHDALQLASVLRNSTAHGSLSATKVCRWGLRPAFVTLGTNIGDVVVAALGQLVA